MPKIKLFGGKTAKISTEDKVLLLHKWQLDPYGYPKRSPVLEERRAGVPSTYMLHREVMSRFLGRPLKHREIVDHINGDKLDARRENLRIATMSENMRNCKKSQNKSSIYKGVGWDKTNSRWQAHIYKDSQLIKIAISKNDDKLLAELYDVCAIYHYGEVGRMNFPENLLKYKSILEEFGDPLGNIGVYKDILKRRG